MTLRACLFLLLATLAPLSAAPVFEQLAAFEQPGQQPMAPLTYVASDGNYYGTTNDGGTGNKGTIFRMTPAGVVTTLVNFTGVNGANPGSNPNGSLIIGPDGALYGVTLGGGAEDYGTIFKITTGGSFASITHFNGINAGLLTPRGSLPNELVLHSDGNFYGSTQAGGANNQGTIFRLAPLLNLVTTLLNFSGSSGSYRGSQPVGALVVYNSYLYGVTQMGGASDYGTVFKMGTIGSPYTILAEFTGATGARYGSYPGAGLTLHSDNMFYGTTETGGIDEVGIIFKISAAGAFTVVRHFADTDGAYPSGRLLVGADLALYGMTTAGGDEGEGAIYKITTAGAFTPLVQFTGKDGAARGSAPLAGLAKGAVEGEFVGTTSAGGAGGGGTAFKVTSSGAFTHLTSFTNESGWEPSGTPAADSADSLIVPLQRGGANGEGTLFRIQNGGPTVAVTNFGEPLGEEPEGGLSLIGETIFGATRRGGPTDRGTVFSYSKAGVATTLGAFATYSGTRPEGPMTAGPDGFLYTVAQEGGGYGKGAIVRFSQAGTRQTVMSFTGTLGGALGQRPRAPLAFGSDGSIYGVTELGGAADVGTIYRLSPDGAFTTLVEFTNSGLRTPRAGLVSQADGSFVGTCTFGGSSGFGGVFKITEQGVMSVLAQFNGTNGAKPSAPLAIAVDGTIYGTTQSGGPDNFGTVFRITTNGTLTRLFAFTGSSGSAPGESPAGGLSFSADGSLRGATSSGGPGGGGTVYSVRQLGPHAATDPVRFALGIPFLRGRANAGGEITTSYFEYGPTAALGQNTLLTPAIVIGGGVTTFETALLLTTLGQTIYYRSVAINNSGTSYGQILSFKVPSILDLWLLDYFGNTVVDLLSDSDGDGKLNLLEYALGSNPVEPDTAQPTITMKQYPEGRRLSMILQRDPSHNDVTIEVLAGSSVNGPWAILASSVNGAPFSGPGYVGGDGAGTDVRQVEIRDTVAMSSAPRRFMRVKVTK